MKEFKIISYFKFTPSWTLKERISGWAVSLWTNSKYFHTEILIDGKRITSHTKNGVSSKEELLRKDIEKYANIIEIEVSEENFEKGIIFANKQIGKAYDWKGIFLTQFINIHKENPDKYFCTEICAEILKIMGVSKLTKNSNEYNPGSFDKLLLC